MAAFTSADGGRSRQVRREVPKAPRRRHDHQQG
jgi:hypothetical protein